MKTHSFQKRSTESSDRLVANIQPRSVDDRSDQPLLPGVDFSHVDLFSHTPSHQAVQAKLTVGAPNDRYEQEADQVASQVMGIPDSAAQPSIQRQEGEDEELQAKPIATTITPLVQRADSDADSDNEDLQAKPIANALQRAMPEEEESASTVSAATPTSTTTTTTTTATASPEEEVQMKPLLQRASDGTAQASNTLETQLGSSKGGGTPLPADVRDFMEPRFGADFSQVRVHTDSEAVQMNRDLSAQAFTHGSDVYFGAGKLPAKDDLTAHELTHVVQQTGGAVQPQQRQMLQAKDNIIQPWLDENGKFFMGLKPPNAETEWESFEFGTGKDKQTRWKPIAGKAKEEADKAKADKAIEIEAKKAAAEAKSAEWEKKSLAKDYSSVFLEDPGKIRFSQDSISGFFSSGKPIQGLVNGLKNGTVKASDVPPLMVLYDNGLLFTLDNRRLWAFQKAKMQVRCRFASPKEIESNGFKFTSENAGKSIKVRK